MKGKLVLFCVLAVFMGACSSKYYIRRGNAIYETGRFYKAADKYDKAFAKAKKPEMRVKSAMLAAQCMADVNKLADAHNWYRKASQADKKLGEPILKMAEANTRRGEFDAALANYDHYAELFSEDERVADGRYEVETLKSDMEKKTRYAVDLKKEFNSRSGDFAPMFYPEDNSIVFFTSNRQNEKGKGSKKDPVTGESACHIYMTEFTQEVKSLDNRGEVKVKRFAEAQWTKPEVIKAPLWSAKGEGAVTFTPEGSEMYFTSPRLVDGFNRGTRIYKVKRVEDERTGRLKWDDMTKSGVCGDTVSVGHPAISPDGSRLYFATDKLSGGMGGRDIWYVESEGGKWGEPQNVGEPVNTPGDEMYPYVRDNGELYFASNGHGGYGGLDIYRMMKDEEGGEEKLVHLPMPINSYSDDFGITFYAGRDEGYFTSSRVGRNDRIYSFVYIPQQLSVRVTTVDNVTGAPIPKADITVTSDDGTITYLATDSTGLAAMEVMPQQEYVFVAENKRYLKGKGTISTYREKSDRVFEVQIEMQPIDQSIVIPNIYFDLGKWDLRQDAMDNLKEVLEILNDNPNIAIELSAHTDMIGNDRANLELSEKRAQSVVYYLISQGIYWDRLVSKGYGETRPRQIDEKTAKNYSFLKVGDVLTEPFINRLGGEEREEALQLNRRIEFKVTRTNYVPSLESRHNPNQKARTAQDTKEEGETQLRDLKSVKGHFFTLQLGVFKTVPALIYKFRVVFTERVGSDTVRYCTGVYDTKEEANAAAAELRKKGTECIVKEYN